MKNLKKIKSILLGVVLLFLYSCTQERPEKRARQIIEATGCQGGLVVHVGCDNGRLTAALRLNESYLVQGLCPDMESVANARDYLKNKKLTGKVSVRYFDEGFLPYADNMVNLLVAEDLGDISKAEVDRVLAPRGTAYIKAGGSWKKETKPWPKEIDEWTHFLHGPDNNTVANDMLVGSPKRIQWEAGPTWTRSHEMMSSVVAMVSAGGRMFYIIDEGPTHSGQMPPDWQLVCRDAFNGVLLWKREIPEWQPHHWPLKSGPNDLPRRLVAVSDRVYVTLGILAPVVQLDARTGKTLRTYKGTEGTEEILFSDGTLFLQMPADPQVNKYVPDQENCWAEAARARQIGAWRSERNNHLVAIDADTGGVIWHYTGPVARMSLTVGGNRVFFHTGTELIAADRHTGKTLWKNNGMKPFTNIPLGRPPTMVAYGDCVLYKNFDNLFVIDVQSGETRWQADLPGSGHFSAQDVIVIDGVIWSAGSRGQEYVGKDIETGEVVKSFSPPSMEWFHPRCYRSKATCKYLLTSRTGIEVVDMKNEQVEVNNWIRGTCLYGIMPANGLIYTPPNPCACLLESKTTGLIAMGSGTDNPIVPVADSQRLDRGPAYGYASDAQVRDEDWPTYRHDMRRSGSTSVTAPEMLAEAWSVPVGGELTSPVAAGDMLIVADKQGHQVSALDADSGEQRWQFVAGGRVDSPPTLYRGLVLFGSADGYVYALRAKDGELAWRFLAAANQRQVVSYGQLESIWPVHGSVLIMNDSLYFVAGRIAFLDGGLRVYKLDPVTGEMLAMSVINEIDPETGQNLQKLQAGYWGLTLPTAKSDILSGNGKRFYMRSQPFTPDCKRTRTAPNVNVEDQGGEDVHLFSPVGFVDDNWHHRSYWIYGTTSQYAWMSWMEAGKYAPSGRILAFDDESIYGFGRKAQFYAQAPVMEYRLFKASNAFDLERAAKVKQNEKAAEKRAPKAREWIQTAWKSRGELMTDEEATAMIYSWIKSEPDYQFRAMVLTKNALYVAGLPDTVDEIEVWRNPYDNELQRKLTEQVAAWRGERGGELWVVSKANGSKIAGLALETPPVFDGMIAFKDRIYISLMNGKVICLKSSK